MHVSCRNRGIIELDLQSVFANEQERGALAVVKSLDLSHNELSQLGGLQPFSSLVALDLSYNRLASLGGLPLGLTRLNVSQNNLTSLQGLGTLPYLQELDASSNKLTDVTGVQRSATLVTVKLADNRLSKMHGLDALPHLQTLDIENNFVKQAEDVACLAACPLLKTLTMAGNPLANHATYRSSVAATVPQLVKLDGTNVVRGFHSDGPGGKLNQSLLSPYVSSGTGPATPRNSAVGLGPGGLHVQQAFGRSVSAGRATPESKPLAGTGSVKACIKMGPREAASARPNQRTHSPGSRMSSLGSEPMPARNAPMPLHNTDPKTLIGRSTTPTRGGAFPHNPNSSSQGSSTPASLFRSCPTPVNNTGHPAPPAAVGGGAGSPAVMNKSLSFESLRSRSEAMQRQYDVSMTHNAESTPSQQAIASHPRSGFHSHPSQPAFGGAGSNERELRQLLEDEYKLTTSLQRREKGLEAELARVKSVLADELDHVAELKEHQAALEAEVEKERARNEKLARAQQQTQLKFRDERHRRLGEIDKIKVTHNAVVEGLRHKLQDETAASKATADLELTWHAEKAKLVRYIQVLEKENSSLAVKLSKYENAGADAAHLVHDVSGFASSGIKVSWSPAPGKPIGASAAKSAAKSAKSPLNDLRVNAVPHMQEGAANSFASRARGALSPDVLPPANAAAASMVQEQQPMRDRSTSSAVDHSALASIINGSSVSKAPRGEVHHSHARTPEAADQGAEETPRDGLSLAELLHSFQDAATAAVAAKNRDSSNPLLHGERAASAAPPATSRSPAEQQAQQQHQLQQQQQQQQHHAHLQTVQSFARNAESSTSNVAEARRVIQMSRAANVTTSKTFETGRSDSHAASSTSQHTAPATRQPADEIAWASPVARTSSTEDITSVASDDVAATKNLEFAVTLKKWLITEMGKAATASPQQSPADEPRLSAFH
ncbi:Dynein regulatory complex subunit 3 [Diplonema papillatum]|nr:Dynein regulatory complex subunit 3 [Diplonema papillatum]